MRLAQRLEELSERHEADDGGNIDFIVSSFEPFGVVRGIGEVSVEANEVVAPDLSLVFYSIRLSIKDGNDRRYKFPRDRETCKCYQAPCGYPVEY